MPLSTAGDLVNFCFRASGVNGVGQTPSADDMTDALTMLSSLIAQWQRKRWLVWDLAETILLSSGAASYTVGPTGNFPIARPDRLESAFARLIPSASIAGTFINNGGVLTISGSSLPTSPIGLNGGSYWNNGGVVSIVPGAPASTNPGYVDLQLALIQSREDYNRIALKGMSSVPAGVFYDSAFPVGTLYFWPIPPAAAYELHIFTKTTLPALATETALLAVPPEYIEALTYSLIVRMAMNWGLEPKPAHVSAMRAALNTIRIANLQVASLRMPAGLPRGRNSGVSADVNPSFLSGWW